MSYGIIEDVALDEDNNPIAGASVYVYGANTSVLASLFQTSSGTPASNPVSTNSNGQYTCYAAYAAYDIKITKTGYNDKWIYDVQAYPVANDSNIVYVSQFDTLDDAITAIGSSEKTLIIDIDTTVSTGVVIPTTTEVRVDISGSIAKAGSGTITFNGKFQSLPRTVFTGFSSGNITFSSGSVSVVNPQWFGATGDGSTDDITAINMAINASPTGSIIDFGNAPVQYLISAPIIYKSHRVYRGSLSPLRVVSGVGKQDIKLADSSNCNMFQDYGYQNNDTASYASHVIFDGLSIDGNLANNSSGHGILMLGGSYVEVKNCVFKAIKQDGIHIRMQTANSTSLSAGWYGSTNIHNNTWYGFGRYGVYSQAPVSTLKNTDSYIINNLSIDGKGSGGTNGEWAVYLEGSAGWHISENHSFNTLNGIYAASPANNNAIADNIVEYSGSTTGGPYYGIYSKMTWDAFSLGTIISRNYLWLWGTTAGIEYYGVALEPNDSGGTFWQQKKWYIGDNMFRGFTDTVTRAVGVKVLYNVVTDVDACEIRIRNSMFPSSLPDARRYEVTHHAVFDHLDGLPVETSAASYYATPADYFIQGDATANNVTVYLPVASRSRGRTIFITRKDSGETYAVTVAKQGSDTLEGVQYIYQPGAMLIAYSDGTQWYVSGQGGVRFRNGTPVGNSNAEFIGQILINTFPAPHTAWIATETGTGGWIQIG